MKNKKKFLFVLSLLSLVSCGTSVESNSSQTDLTTSSTSQAGSELSSFSTTYQNTIDTFTSEERIDILSDYDSQVEEDFSSVENIIDVSMISESVEITQGGTYILKGENENARVIVNSSSDVKLILNGVNLKSETDAPIEVKTAASFNLYLASKTKNYLTDTTASTSEATLIVKKVKPNISGAGYLYVSANGTEENDSGVGIQAAKGLNIQNSHIIVESTSHALNAKAGVEITSSKLYLTSKADGIHSKEGGVTITSSTLDSDSYGDGIDAALEVSLTDVISHITSTGTYVLYDANLDTDGSLYEDSKYILENGEYKKISSDDMNRYQTRYYLSQKCKGVKSEMKVSFDGGNHYFYTADDSIASDTEIDIVSGDYSFYTLDQAINSDQLLYIGMEDETESDLDIHIYHSYEGIQGGVIHFYYGNTYIVSEDDGINATSDTLDDVNMNFHESSYVCVSGDGDGIDSNGDINMDGGTLIVYGPTNGGNSALDFDGKFSYTGGDLFAVSATGMVQTPSVDNINVVSYTASNYSKGDLLSFIVDDKEFSLIIPKDYNSFNVIVGSSDFKKGDSLKILHNASTTATFVNYSYIGSVVSSSSATVEETTMSTGLNRQYVVTSRN